LAYERLVRKITKENLWVYILTLLARSPLYGYEIRDKIEKEFGFRPGKVSCYVVLYRLEKSGLISVRGEEKSGQGPPRKYYTLTRNGHQTLLKARSFLSNLLESLS